MSEGNPWTSTSARGAAGELLAAAHLMRKGWYVYRCQSPAAPFDLVAYQHSTGELLRVEVKSANQTPAPRSGSTVSDETSISFSWPTNDDWDLLIAVDDVAGVCIEITDKNPLVGRDLVRAHFGVSLLADHGPTAVDLVFSALKRAPEVDWTVDELARLTGLDKPRVSRGAKALVESGRAVRSARGVYRSGEPVAKRVTGAARVAQWEAARQTLQSKAS